MYPFASLPENLIAFCAVLGRDHGFRIGAGEVHDAARALEVVDLPDEHAVRHALRPILSGTLHDVTVFDQAFTDFFFPGPAGVRQDQMPSARGEPGPGEDGRDGRVDQERLPSPSPPDADEGDARPDVRDAPIAPLETADGDLADAALLALSSYGPLEAERAHAPALTSPAEADGAGLTLSSRPVVAPAGQARRRRTARGSRFLAGQSSPRRDKPDGGGRRGAHAF